MLITAIILYELYCYTEDVNTSFVDNFFHIVDIFQWIICEMVTLVIINKYRSNWKVC